MARKLPNVSSLEAAVQAVIRSNISDGYRPVRFTQKTQSGNVPTSDLIGYLSRLVLKESARLKVESSLKDHLNLLTMEDFLQYTDWAKSWGFSEEVMDRAAKLAHHYDLFVGFRRWER